MNGQFRACAQALQANFPGLKIEGGPYTPPPYIQHTIRALTGVQMLVPGLYFFGEQLFGLIGRAPPEVKASALKRHVWQVKLLNLSHDLLTTTLPFVLSKVNRVSYGLLSADQVETPPGHFLDTS